MARQQDCERLLRQRLGEVGFEERAREGARLDMDAFADFAVDRLRQLIARAG